MAVTLTSLLTETQLEAFRSRAAGYDRDNKFFQEDFDDLRSHGYMKMAIPRELGGLGFKLAEVARETRHVAFYAPPTALGTNMHTYWVGLAADLWRAGDRSCEWILQEAAAGEIFAAGHAEAGNDLPLLLSTTTAKRVEGGWTFTGRKAFGSLTPVWTRLGVHGMDVSDPAAPKIVHAFIPRGTPGVTVKETWDVLGMRATRSDDTVLDNAFVPDKYVCRVNPAGAAGIDAFVLGIFAWALVNFGNVYYGLAKRAKDLVLEMVKTKGSLGLTRSMAYHPEVQRGVAEMVMRLESIEPQLETVAQDWSNGVDHGHAWPIKLVSAKHNAVTGAWLVVDRAMDLSGGFGMFKKSELERLFRDARAGRFHPTNPALTHELVGKLSLGINPDEQPRWG
jgi:alkylation response protein AidB-like acyl-CoA dehydrogenase